ncbi:MAG: glycosyltransferase family 9 protein [Acidimicrobiales bacterium]
MSAGPHSPLLVALRPLGLGDLLTAVPALRALADAFPGHHRVLAAPAALAPLALLNGAVDEVVATPPMHPLPARLVGSDVAVDLHGRGPASQRVLLASRPARLVAFANAAVAATAGLPRWREDEHEVARWCRLLSESGIPADPARLDLPPPPGVAAPALAAGATVVHPGAASEARRWPAERWAALAHHEVAAGRTVVVTGGEAEVGLASRVAVGAGLDPSVAVLAGRTGLLELAAVVAAAGRVVCGDTGLAHLATAMGTPSVVLFGPVSPSRWGPPPDRPWHRALWAGRTGDPHAATVDPGLLALSVDEVVASLADLPDRPERPTHPLRPTEDAVRRGWERSGT